MKKKSQAFFFVLLFALIQLGTVYVIKEGGVEVGRYEEADGKNEVQEITENGTAPAAAVLNEEIPPAPSLKIQEPAAPLPPRKQAFWTLQGRVLDFLSAKPLTQGKILFLSPEGNAEIKINWNGMFSGKIPKLAGLKYYQLAVAPPQGYTGRFLIYHSGQLVKIPPQQRLANANALVQRAMPPAVKIKDHYVDLEIALLPEKA